eukprot:IDg19383t1
MRLYPHVGSIQILALNNLCQKINLSANYTSVADQPGGIPLDFLEKGAALKRTKKVQAKKISKPSMMSKSLQIVKGARHPEK